MCEKRRLLRPFSGLFRHMGQLLFASHIGTRASIGENCIFQHNGLGVVISDYAVIGRNCMIYQHVTIGVLKDGDTAAPIIEDGVVIGAGAVLLGGITIHQDAKVGAGAVVLHDVPKGMTAVGVPARVVERDAK